MQRLRARDIIRKARGQMVHHQPQSPAGPQILVQRQPHLQAGADLAREDRDQFGRAARDAVLDETDAAAGADRGKLRQIVIGPKRKHVGAEREIP